MIAHSLREAFDQLKLQYVNRCTDCGICVEVCPLFTATAWDGRSPSALHQERMAVLRGGEPTDLIRLFTYSCSNCAKCMRVCPEGLDPFRLTHVMWADMRATGAATLVTGCGGCLRTFGDHENPFTVEYYITLLGKAMGIH